jgi:rRNA maturation protein Rpf1
MGMPALWTTSRYASAGTAATARELAASSGGAFRARGKKTIAELAGFARRQGYSGIMVIEERSGKPSSILSIEVMADGGWRWAGRSGLEDYAGKGKSGSGV